MIESNIKLFEEKFESCKRYFDEIVIPKHKIIKLEKFVREVIKEKNKEQHHQIDNCNEYKRFYTGMLGELAIEEYLGVTFVDLSIGNSGKYNRADLKDLGVNIGIKTVEYGKFPVVTKNPTYPEIINIKFACNKVYVCGVATISILKSHQDDNLILSKKLRERNVKTGFDGINCLIPIKNYYDIKKLRKLKVS